VMLLQATSDLTGGEANLWFFDGDFLIVKIVFIFC
jgi:prepilin-type processing-associated H-X9-DG protein